MPGVVADTHTIVWYLSKDSRLSLAAHAALTVATTGGDLIHIPSICLVELTYLSGNADLKSGEGVVTSGEGEIFPPGIPIGQVVDSRAVEFGLYTEARVKLSTNLGALEQVWVLFP